MAVNSTTADMKLVSDFLARHREFDGSGAPLPEAEYRKKFKFATRDLSDKEKAETWEYNLKYYSPAWIWFESLKADPATSAAATSWMALEKEIEKRWPTPKINLEAYIRQTRSSWENHKLDLDTMAPLLIDDTVITLPHTTWATEHYARGMAVDSTNADRVAYTVRHAIPRTVLKLLPQRQYSSDFSKLCTDIGAINPQDLYYGWKEAADLERLAEQLGALSVSQPRVPRNTSGSQPSNQRAQTSWQSPRIPTTSRSRITFADPPAQVIPQAPEPQASREQPPHMAQQPAPPVSQPQLESDPPPMSDSFLARLQAVQTPGAKLPEVATPNTQENRTVYRDEVKRYETKHGSLTPSPYRPYPLTPGTRRQTADLCPKCGRGNHSVWICPAESKAETVPEPERAYRAIVAKELREGRSPSRAGSQWGTPTPPQRMRDISQLELEEEEQWDPACEFEDEVQGKGQGQ
ncbi:hypothetical protein FS749_004386 [Ceratobasidium sp. UAMH 11750]|nr:hypothetical protein FS749_004386 [Ceratobasidium sp. UAMH 11750]